MRSEIEWQVVPASVKRKINLHDFNRYSVAVRVFLSRASIAQGDLIRARALMSKAESISETTHTSSLGASTRLHLLLENGRLYILEKTPARARVCFVEAWILAINSSEDSLALAVADKMAEIEPRKLQKDWIERAIQLAEESQQPGAKRWLGGLYSALGWRYFESRQYDLGMIQFQKALERFKLDGSKREVFVARWSIGKALRVMGQTEEALAVQRTLLTEIHVDGGQDGRLFEELAECLHKLKRIPEARIYFALAYKELSNDEWIADNQPVALQRLRELGKEK